MGVGGEEAALAMFDELCGIGNERSYTEVGFCLDRSAQFAVLLETLDSFSLIPKSQNQFF